MKGATTILSCFKDEFPSILAVKPHDIDGEIKITLDEILRQAEDISDCGKAIVEVFNDTYGEYCISVKPIYEDEKQDDGGYSIIKTLWESEDDTRVD